MITNKKIKKIVALISLVLLMSVCFSINSFAYNDSDQYVTPRWVSIYNIDIAMSFHEGVGNISATASKQSTSNLIEGTLYMYELVDGEREYMGEWYKSKAIGSLGISVDFACESGVTYIAVFTVTAYTNGVPETETVEYSRTCP